MNYKEKFDEDFLTLVGAKDDGSLFFNKFLDKTNLCINNLVVNLPKTNLRFTILTEGVGHDTTYTMSILSEDKVLYVIITDQQKDINRLRKNIEAASKQVYYLIPVHEEI